MVDTKVLTNSQYAHFVGPATAIPTANWTSGPTLAQLQSLLNISDAVKIGDTDYNVAASDSSDVRSFMDAAGAKSRSFSQASGNIEIFTPARGDDTSIAAQTWNAISHPRTKIAICQRPIKAAGSPIAAGDELNLFLGITDARSHKRDGTIRTASIGILPQGQILVNYIVPAAVAAAPVVTPQGGASLSALTAGTPAFVKVAYQGRNITVGAKYTSSNEAVFKVTNNGVIVPVAAGTATLTVSYPGAATLAPITITVS